ncbi:enoyl-CoA hydratase-related protein [Elongatibacter sediminis]|uniref:Enoyl-CoA hydratase-related protein n=1 Tax=Elongatibacter sediminis TaxID=3119006 RepID=A0AAW9RI99_9GAMM
MSFQTLSYRPSENGVAHIAIDVEGKSVNVLTPELHRELGEVARCLAADDTVSGAIVYSAKSSFMAGGDLNRIVRYYDDQRSPEQAYSESQTYTQSLRALETCGKPVAVAINGTALGGGLELALACHHRIVANDASIRLGLPEVTLGLIPGGGGTQRLPRITGIAKAASLILQGERLTPEQALEIGLVDQAVPADDLIETAEKWVLGEPDPQQPWDVRGFRIPGGSGLNDMKIGRLFQQLTATVAAEYRYNYPAPVAALRCLFNGTTIKSMDQALAVETREFSALTRDPVARNMIRTLFINRAGVKIRELLSDAASEQLKQRCLDAYVRQGIAMAAAGIEPQRIENIAFSAGLVDGPLALAEENTHRKPQSRSDLASADIRDRLMCAQVLAACQCWEEDIIDPVHADLASHFGWGFPSYTGGVMSYVDTLGLNRFIALCDDLTSRTGAALEPSSWLRERAQDEDRIYPPPD